MILKPHSCLFFFSLVNKQLVWVGYQKNKLIVNISQASVQQNYDVGHTEIIWLILTSKQNLLFVMSSTVLRRQITNSRKPLTHPKI